MNKTERARDARITELEAENARLRKVADAAVAAQIAHNAYSHMVAARADYYTRGELNAASDEAEFALQAAVREYRENLPQNYHDGELTGTYHDRLKSAMKPITEDMRDGE